MAIAAIPRARTEMPVMRRCAAAFWPKSTGSQPIRGRRCRTGRG
jgi:hypothetical protein